MSLLIMKNNTSPMGLVGRYDSDGSSVSVVGARQIDIFSGACLSENNAECAATDRPTSQPRCSPVGRADQHKVPCSISGWLAPSWPPNSPFTMLGSPKPFFFLRPTLDNADRHRLCSFLLESSSVCAQDIIPRIPSPLLSYCINTKETTLDSADAHDSLRA